MKDTYLGKKGENVTFDVKFINFQLMTKKVIINFGELKDTGLFFWEKPH